MLSSFRILVFAALGALAGGHTMCAADDDALPPESSVGEWIEDSLNDGSLWFASSENLGFEAIAGELADYPLERRWVHVIDGKPAWVMYYVPGQILGFEIDTHHFGAGATEFRFAAGANWDALAAVEADYEEIVSYEAKWLRLYRASDQLPPGTRFLKIEFPQDAELEAARLTEVWLRCTFDGEPASTAANQIQSVAAVAGPASAPSVSPESEFVIEPFVVTTFVFHPQPVAEPVFPPLPVDASWPAVRLESPPLFARYDLFGDFVPLVEAVPSRPPETSPNVFSRFLDFLRRR